MEFVFCTKGDIIMPIIGFNFNEITAKRNEGSQGGKVEVNNNVSIDDVQEVDISVGTNKSKMLKFIFSFTAKYSPDLGEIKLGGEVMFNAEKAVQDEVIKSWNTDKKVPEKVRDGIINHALLKSYVQAIGISDTVGLPTPLRMPRVANK